MQPPFLSELGGIIAVVALFAGMHYAGVLIARHRARQERRALGRVHPRTLERLLRDAGEPLPSEYVGGRVTILEEGDR